MQQHIQTMNDEIVSLEKVRDVLTMLLSRLQACTQRKITLDALGDETLRQVIQQLTVSKNKLKERVNMEELDKANETLNQSLPCAFCSFHLHGGVLSLHRPRSGSEGASRDEPLCAGKPSIREEAGCANDGLQPSGPRRSAGRPGMATRSG